MDTGLFFSLMLVAALVLLLAAVLWPRVGVLARVRRVRQEAERVRVEDALKNLLSCERAGRPCTLEDLAGRLEVPRGVASEILTRLTERGLALHDATGFVLTASGRKYALRIVRTHRLWERYLADRTGVPAGRWHAEAERVEHRLSETEADHLSARLGHPRYDPHGDPIPTAAGEIPDPEGRPLSRLEAGQAAVVVHVEDEPETVYRRLLKVGLAPGAVLEVVSTGSAVTIRVGGAEHRLRAVDAANVTVEPQPAGEVMPMAGRTLADAKRGEPVRVVGIAPSCQGPQRRRLLDLGVVPGTEIVPELVSASGDPVAYRIRGALIGLRRQQAEWIEVAADSDEPVGRAS